MRPVVGRLRDALQVDGVRFFPSQVESVLVAERALALDFRLVADGGRITVHCAPRDAAADRPALADRLRGALRAAVGADLGVVVEPPGTGPRTG
jgi:phenylacetate-CoA ligase